MRSQSRYFCGFYSGANVFPRKQSFNFLNAELTCGDSSSSQYCDFYALLVSSIRFVFSNLLVLTIFIPHPELTAKPNYFSLFQASSETWSAGNTQISEIEKMRSRAAKPKENLYKTSLQTKLRYDSETVADDFPGDLPCKLNESEATNKSLLSKLNPFKRKIPHQMKRHSIAPGSELDPQMYLRNTQNGRASVSSLSKNYLSQHRPSMFALPGFEEEQDLLESTTIADLIRAIEEVHTDSAAQSLPPDVNTKKQRKLGTDHLTPPHHRSLLTLGGKQQSSHTIHGPSSDLSPLKLPVRSRLNSCVSTPTENDNSRGKILGDENPFIRRVSLRPPPPYTITPSSDSTKATVTRRFSVRPANLDKAPGQFHKPSNLPVTATPSQPSSLPVMPFQRKLSWRPTPSSLAAPNDVNDVKKSGR